MDSMDEIFIDLYKEWFANKQFWFDKKLEYDTYLSEKYFMKIRDKYRFDIEVENNSKEIVIGAIIALDQLPRHYNRISAIDCNVYSKVASDISSAFLDSLNDDYVKDKSITAHEWCFIMLPFRHLRIQSKINMMIDDAMFKYNECGTSHDDKQIYKNFIRNAINDVYKTNTSEYISIQNGKDCIDNLKHEWDCYENILCHCPMKTILDIDRFKQYDIVKQFTESVGKIKDGTNIIVSLSGGVDSCVSLYLMKKLFPTKDIIAVHINYNNRSECEDELQFVMSFCSVMNVKLYYRTITEVKREDCHFNGLRDMYEVVTKAIRFDMYDQVSKTFPNNEMDTLVLLGHNKDDCFENIITNISMKNNYSNLSGTEEFATISQIGFWRPLLNVMKCDIIDFAYIINIPYLRDSTPSWSARGKIRDVIYPALTSINPDIMGSYFALKNHMATSDELINTYVLPMIMNKFEFTCENVKGLFELNELACYHNIWSKIFSTVEFNGIMCNRTNSFKSIEQFVEMLKRFKMTFETMREQNIFNVKTKFVLRKDIDVIIYRTRDDKVMISFDKRFF